MDLKRPLLVVLLALVSAPAADARARFHLIGRGSVTTDGERYATLVDREGTLYRVIDDVLGRSWTVPDAPPGCTPYSVQVADGHLLWDCPTPTGQMYAASRPVLQSLETGEIRPVPGWDTYLSEFAERAELGWTGSGPMPDGFGSHWVRASVQCYHCLPEYTYLNWRTGGSPSLPADVARFAFDLDAPGLAVPLCSPLRRPTLDYERPWLLRSQTGRYVQLYRCGHRKPLRIHRCSAPSSCRPQLGGGYLTWSEPPWARSAPVIKAFRLADRRRLTIGKLKGAVTVQHTRRALYVQTNAGKLYAARLPRR
jgi:hypothetical protein